MGNESRSKYKLARMVQACSQYMQAAEPMEITDTDQFTKAAVLPRMLQLSAWSATATITPLKVLLIILGRDSSFHTIDDFFNLL